jgi:hypothetical protein
MASRRRPTQLLDEQPTRRAPDLDPCSYVEIVSPAIDPNRELLHRVFFLNDDKSKYVGRNLPRAELSTIGRVWGD